MNLRVIDGKGGFRAVPFHSERDRKTIYNRIYNECLDNMINISDDITGHKLKGILKKFIFSAVKAYDNYDISYATGNIDFMKSEFEKLMNIMRIMSYLSPYDIYTMFPPTKDYKGLKHGKKDYYTSIEAVKRAGGNSAFINDAAAYDFLCAYSNQDIDRFLIAAEYIIGEFKHLQAESLMQDDQKTLQSAAPHLYVVH